MKCSRCGREIAENSQYCEFCGQPIVKKNRDIKPGWILLVLITAVLIGIGCYWYGGMMAVRQQDTHQNITVSDSTVEESFSVVNEEQSDFPEKELVKSVLMRHIECIENDDYDGLQSIFAPRLLRYYSKKNVSRSEIIANHRNYNSTYGVYGKSASYRWETLSVKKKSNTSAEVVCVMDYHIDRVEENKPTDFVLELHFVLDNNYQIVSVYDKQLSKY